MASPPPQHFLQPLMSPSIFPPVERGGGVAMSMPLSLPTNVDQQNILAAAANARNLALQSRISSPQPHLPPPPPYPNDGDADNDHGTRFRHKGFKQHWRRLR